MNMLLARLWPPYELSSTETEMAKRLPRPTWQQVFEKSNAVTAGLTDQQVEAAEKLADAVLESEMKRKDMLEAKASTFIVTPSLATAITAAIPTLTRDLKLSPLMAAMATMVYALALVHFLVSSYFAVQARRAEALVVLSPENARQLLAETRPRRVAMRLAYAESNEQAMVRKANRLSVSEDLTLRGLALLASASVLTLLAHLAQV